MENNRVVYKSPIKKSVATESPRPRPHPLTFVNSLSEDLGIVNALYLEIKDSEDERLQKLAQKLKAYVDGGFDEDIEIHISDVDDITRVTY